MKKYSTEKSSEAIYMGLDLHRKSWHLTIRTQQQELKKMSLPPQWEALRRIIDDCGAARVTGGCKIPITAVEYSPLRAGT